MRNAAGSEPYRLLVVDDDHSLLEVLEKEISKAGPYIVDTASDGAEAIKMVQRRLYDLILLDLALPVVGGMEVLQHVRTNYPSTEVIMLTAYGSTQTAVKAMKLGAFDFIDKPFDMGHLLATMERALERRRLFLDNELIKSELARRVGPSELIGESPNFRRVIESALRLAESETTVLIQGASGTGKELIAQLIHRRSARKDRPFVVMNCASIPEGLLESELFGHEKGAFTNAFTLKQGLVEVANGGTLFLDEVGDISPVIQPKLLRFLETGEFRRVGGTNTLRVDVRIVSATNKDLQAEARAGRFREDLLYRLNVVTIRVPPLRERKSDIPLLVDYFLHTKFKSRIAKRLSPAAMEMLMNYDWPGNVRELEHVIEGAVLLSQRDTIEPSDLFLSIGGNLVDAVDGGADRDKVMPLDEMERISIERALKIYQWNKAQAAKALGISIRTLYLKLKRYGLPLHPEMNQQ
ncbi:MAG: sigma-54-dependent transcriptional regulator [Bacteroidota bacterium]